LKFKRNIKEIPNHPVLDQSRIAILLTMCADTEEKVEMYKNVLNHWLNSSTFIIFSVDSSGSDKFSLSTNPRWKPFSFRQFSSKKNTSCLEVDSIMNAYKQFKADWNFFDLVVKVTGKYFLPDFESVVKKVSKETNLLLQNTHKVFPIVGMTEQNSEIFGINPSLIPDFVNHFRKRNGYIEHSLSNYRTPKTFRLPKLKVSPLTKYPRRSGNTLEWL
jgi:hypothetical protein